MEIIRKSAFYLVFLFVCFFGLWVKKAEALPSLWTSDQFQINPDVTWNQNYPSIACSNRESKCLIVWRDKRNDPGGENDGANDSRFYGANSNADIYGQFVSSAGSFGDFIIATDISSPKVDQAMPEAVYNSVRNEFLVVWHEADPAATSPNNNDFCVQGGYNIYGRRVSPLKELLGEKIVISEAADCQWKPRIAYDKDKDMYLVVWHDFRHRATNQADSLGKEIYGQFIKGDGTVLGGNYLFSRDTADETKKAARYQEYASVAYDSDRKKFLIVWMDDRETTVSGFSHDIWGILVSFDGSIFGWGKNFPVYRGSGKSENPEISYDLKNKEYVLVWSEFLSNGTKVPKMIRLSPEGSVIGGALDIDSAINHPAFPAVGINPDNGERLIGYEHGNTAFVGFLQTAAITAKSVFSPWTYARPPIAYNNTGSEFFSVYSGASGGFARLYFRRIKIGDVPVTGSPTGTATPSPGSPTNTPAAGACSCPAGKPAKNKGNTNCDDKIDGVDFEIWREEFLGSRTTQSADFNCDSKIDGVDFEIWRENRN